MTSNQSRSQRKHARRLWAPLLGLDNRAYMYSVGSITVLFTVATLKVRVVCPAAKSRRVLLRETKSLPLSAVPAAV